MKLVETKFYGQLMVISDYLLLGLLWIIISLPIFTIIPASVAILFVIKAWRGNTTGRIFYLFFHGMKKNWGMNLIMSGLTVSVLYSTNLLLKEENQILNICGYVISIVFLMFILSWCDNCSQQENYSLFVLFEKSSLDLIAAFLRNLMCIFIIIIFSILVFLFPPFIFIFVGGVWKIIDFILSRKSRFDE